jgi:transporter family protein
VRTLVVLIFAWVVVFQSGESHALRGISKRSLTYLVLSGLATGISWLAYFRALQLGPASRVAPVDKLSLPLTVVFAALLLGESVGWKVWIGVLLMTVGALLTIA